METASAAPPRPAPARDAGSRRLTLDFFEWATLAALFAFGAGVLAAMLARVWLNGGVATGADSYVTVDQLQYLNWIRQVADHGAAANLYDVSSTHRDFVHPGVLAGALLHRLGLGLAASYQLLKPVAVIALFAAVLLYARRFLTRRADRRLALVLALFAVSPVAAVVGWSGAGSTKSKLRFDFLTGELWTGNYLWGFIFTAIAVALVPLGLLAYERGRGGGSRRALAAAAAAGLLCSWLQPWQGVTFALVIAAAEAVCLRRGPSRTVAKRAAGDLALPLVATAAPLAYYLVLSLSDPAWELAGQANEDGSWPWWVMILGLAPLALPALAAYRLPAPDFGAIALRVWPVVAVAVFYQPAGTFPAHAVQGLTIPLMILGTLVLRARLGSRPLGFPAAAAICLVLILPGLLDRADALRGAVHAGLQPFFLADDEHDALLELERAPEAGGVLAPFYSGQLVPAYTGRATWVGASSWTPDFRARRKATDRLFAGTLSPRAAERLVRRSRVRFLYSDCQKRADITRLVARVAGPPRRFGCAALYRVR